MNLKDPSAADDMQKTLLADVCSLIGVRWGMDVQITTCNGKLYAYGIHQRITVGNSTLRNALGLLASHIDFIRGTPHDTAQALADYRECKEKWQVSDPTSESTTGWDERGSEETSHTSKRRRI